MDGDTYWRLKAEADAIAAQRAPPPVAPFNGALGVFVAVVAAIKIFEIVAGLGGDLDLAVIVVAGAFAGAAYWWLQSAESAHSLEAWREFKQLEAAYERAHPEDRSAAAK
jgi:hypothetical protein